MSHEETLDLSALAPVRPQARLRTLTDPEGTLYELAVPEDFGAVDLRKLGNRYAELEGLLASEKALTKAQEKRVERLTNEVAAALLPDAPAADVASLPFTTKRALVMRFFVGLGDEMLTVMGPEGQKLLAVTSES